MKTTRTFLCLLSLIAFFIMGIASNPARKTFGDGDKLVPKDFNPDQGILLVQTHPSNDKENNKMIEFLQQTYLHPFEVVDRSVIENRVGKYADIKKYPFGILWVFRSSVTTVANSNGSTGHSYHNDLYGHFLDRTGGNAYPETNRYNNYGKNGYKPFFNSIVKHFK